MMLASTLTLSILAMFSAQIRLSERKLGDVAVISIPRSIKEEMYKGGVDSQQGRLTFTFATSYFWASFGSGTAYKQQIFVALMAKDATDAEYEEYPKWWSLSYDKRKTIRKTSVGSGSLTVYEGIYTQNSLAEPSHTFFYVDRARRLNITWHAVTKEVSLDEGVEAIGRMAASFRILKDPTETFAEVRDRPRKEAEEAARRRSLAMETLEREGYGAALEAGTPVFKEGVYLEWMTDPEPRYQMLVPLGRVRVAPDAAPGNRPRPVRLDLASGSQRSFPGFVGWREFLDGEWTASNYDNGYLPFKGITAKMAEQNKDPGFVYFYYSATVRVEEMETDDVLTTTKWFFNRLPEIQQLWSAGKLVRGGTPVND
jgi:hypothetical protein